MRKIKNITLIFMLLFLVGTAFAQLVTIGFKDATQGTLNLVREEEPTYPTATPADYARWRVQLYTSTDGIIDPLDENGNPTGDDVLASPHSPTTGHVTLAFGPSGALGISNFVFAQPGGAGNCWHGSNVYVRIFNAPEINNATKYIVFNNMYTVPTSNSQQQIPNAPINGWSAWTNIGGVGPTDYTISGMFTTTSWDFADINIVATGIDAEDIVINGANYEITVPEGWTGTVTPTKAGYIMTPANREYTNVEADFENQNYAISKNVDPNAPVITYPAPGQVFTWEEAGEVTILWEAGAGYVPEYYEAQWNMGDWTNVGIATEWTTPAIGAGDYTFKVRAVIDTPMGKSAVPIRARATDRNAANTVRGTGPEAMVEFEVVIDVPPVYTISLDSTPELAEIYQGETLLGVAPVVVDPAVVGTYTAMLEGYTFEAFEVTEITGDIVHTFVGTFVPPTYDIDPGVPAELDPATDLTITGAGFVGGNVLSEGMTNVPNPTFVATSEGIMQLVGTGLVTLTFDFDPAVDWFVYRTGGAWTAIAGPLTTYSFQVDLGSKDSPFEWKGGGGGDPTLPVELSVFNAVLTAQNFVKLSWISESETNMLGYRVYRAESADQAAALLITPIMIQATNTSTTQNYSIEDREVSTGNTYYYWLEAVDYSHSSFFGYRAAEVLGDVTPELPVQSAMKSAYPNPFRASSNTNIEVSVKAGETGTVTIYNVLGQVVKTYSVSEGNHNIIWNARDSRGNICGSGIYFYKMSTPSRNQTKKMVIVK